MTTAFQANAFQNNAFQIDVGPVPQFLLLGDLDKSGTGYQMIDTFLGPSLGRTLEQVKPADYITDPGTYSIIGASLILVIAGGATTFNLPDVRTWMKQPGRQPATAFERSIWIKDLGGNASNFNITIVPFGIQTIDGLANLVIVENHKLVRLYPLNDLTGWYAA